MMKPKNRPPSGITKQSQKLWTELYSNYDNWDEASVRLLNELCKVNDIIQDCEKKIKKDGILLQDRFGQQIAHPLLRVLKEHRTQFLRFCKELGLLSEDEEKNKVGRPGMY